MHIHAIDAYRPRTSVVHALDARLKLALGLLFILSVAVAPLGSLLAHVLLGALGLIVVVASRLGNRYVQRRALAALPFALAAVTVVFYTPGSPLLVAELLGRRLVVTDQGLVHFASILLKSWASIQVAVVLAASTPFASLLRAMRSLGLPKVLVATIGFAYRYIFVIGDEALVSKLHHTGFLIPLHTQWGLIQLHLLLHQIRNQRNGRKNGTYVASNDVNRA